MNTKGMIDKYGEQNLRDLLAERRQAARAFEEGHPERGRQFWRQRNQDDPEWLYWYHGVFG